MSHELIARCLRHRAEHGIRWRTGKTMCSVPSPTIAHKSAKVKGTRRINSQLSSLVLKEIGQLISPVAETRKSEFRSTHRLEKVRHRILLEQCLLSKALYVIKWKSGIRSEINGCFLMSPVLQRENEATEYRTFGFTIVAPKSTDMR